MIEIGSEKRFFDFIKDLNDKDKIALISHVDLDGIVSAKVVNSVVDADLVKFLQYDEIDSKLAEILKVDGYNKIIISDLYVEDENVLKEMEKFADILILDHHPAQKDWNSDKTTFIKAEKGNCATYLCYKLFNKLQNIEKLDWVVTCACIADFCNIVNSDWIEEVFDKYRQEKGEYMKKIGFDYADIEKSEIYKLQWLLSLSIIYFRDNLNKMFEQVGDEFGDIGNLKEYAEEVQGEIDSALDRFEKEKKEIKGGFLFVFTPERQIGSIVSNVISSRNPYKVIIIMREKEEGYSLSARRQDSKGNMGEFVKSFLKGLDGARGGGHVEAAGGYFLKKDFDEVMRRLEDE